MTTSSERVNRARKMFGCGRLLEANNCSTAQCDLINTINMFNYLSAQSLGEGHNMESRNRCRRRLIRLFFCLGFVFLITI